MAVTSVVWGYPIFESSGSGGDFATSLGEDAFKSILIVVMWLFVWTSGFWLYRNYIRSDLASLRLEQEIEMANALLSASVPATSVESAEAPDADSR